MTGDLLNPSQVSLKQAAAGAFEFFMLQETSAGPEAVNRFSPLWSNLTEVTFIG